MSFLHTQTGTANQDDAFWRQRILREDDRLIYDCASSHGSRPIVNGPLPALKTLPSELRSHARWEAEVERLAKNAGLNPLMHIVEPKPARSPEANGLVRAE